MRSIYLSIYFMSTCNHYTFQLFMFYYIGYYEDYHSVLQTFSNYKIVCLLLVFYNIVMDFKTI